MRGHDSYIMHEYNYSHWLTTTYSNSDGLFAGEIELNTCCVAMVKLRGESCRVVDGSSAPDWPKSHLPSWSFPLYSGQGAARVSKPSLQGKTEALELCGTY